MCAVSIGERVKLMRGLRLQSEFATALQTSQPMLSRTERGASMPTTEMLIAVAQLGWNPLWVLTGQGAPRIDEHSEAAPVVDAQELPGFVLVPRYNISASMGPGIDVQSEQIVDYYAFRLQFLEFIGVLQENAAVIRLRGRSMEGVLEDRDTVLVDLADRRIMPAREGRKEDIYVFRISGDNELFAKFASALPDDMIRLRSSESSGLPDVMRKVEDVVVLGRVRWMGRTIV